MINLDRFLDGVGIDGRNDVFIHSGYRAFQAEGVPIDRVLDRVLAHQDQRATMMPAFTWRTVSPEAPFDARSTPSIVGALTEVYRRRPQVRRSLHPTHSCLIGARHFEIYGATHGKSLSPCDEWSPFAAFADRNVRLVLLNCSIDTLTYVHYFEEFIHPDHYLADRTETVDVIDGQGFRRPFVLRRHRKLPRRFGRFMDDLASMPSFRHQRAGAVEGWSVLSDDAAFILSRRFAENVYASA
jgi:aminoglycoside 3-N-acetyltransferase